MRRKTNLIELDKDHPDHLQMMYSVRTHPEVDQCLTGSPPSNFADHVNYLRHVGPHKKFYLIQVDSTLSGYSQLTVFDHQVEIGMALHPHYCGQGIGSAALALLLDRLRKNEENKNKALILFVKKDNLRAIALYAKYGFKQIGDANENGEYLMKKVDDD